jgi:hypothetical protein
MLRAPWIAVAVLVLTGIVIGVWSLRTQRVAATNSPNAPSQTAAILARTVAASVTVTKTPVLSTTIEQKSPAMVLTGARLEPSVAVTSQTNSAIVPTPTASVAKVAPTVTTTATTKVAPTVSTTATTKVAATVSTTATTSRPKVRPSEFRPSDL